MSTIKITTAEDEEFFVEKAHVIDCITIKNMLDDIGSNGGDNVVPLVNISSEVFKKILEYSRYHSTHTGRSDTSAWDKKFCEQPIVDVFKLILAANYLDYRALLHTLCGHVSSRLSGKSVEEMRSILNIKNDFTPEEEEQIRKENEWCEER